MAAKIKENIVTIMKEVKEEYDKAGGDLFLFLFSHFFPKIDTKSDYITDKKGRYHCQCDFAVSGIESVQKALDALIKHFGMDFHGSYIYLYLDIKSMTISNDCTDEQYGDHFIWYGEESDYYFFPVKTHLALKDKKAFKEIEKEQPQEYVLIKMIFELYKDLFITL